MRALFDVNILLALLDQDHLRHDHARSWWASERRHGWASCPLTQNGFLRIVTQKSYLRPKGMADALAILTLATSRAEHVFWPDDVSVLNSTHVDHGRLLGPRQITDVYLLALAVQHGGRLVTLDRGISLAAVRGATAENLVFV